MIVDVGGGTTEVAVISLGGIVVSQSLRVGGDEMDDAIVTHIKKEYKLLVGQQTAEEIKLEIGSAYRMKDEVQAERGRDMLTGLPKTVIVSSEEIRRASTSPSRRSSTRSSRRSTRRRLSWLRTSWTAGSSSRAAVRSCTTRRAAPPRDADARAPGGEPADLRRRRLRPLARGVRGDPPLEPFSRAAQRQQALGVVSSFGADLRGLTAARIPPLTPLDWRGCAP